MSRKIPMKKTHGTHPYLKQGLEVVNAIVPSTAFLEGKDKEEVEKYQNRCISYCIENGEAPIVAEKIFLFHQVPSSQKSSFIEASLTLEKLASKTVVFTDFGITDIMKWHVAQACSRNQNVQYRKIDT